MTTLNDLPASAVRLIMRCAQTRHIPGTNRYAHICRRWYDAAIKDDLEQPHLLLELKYLPPGSLTSTSQWLLRHGSCVPSLHITYDPSTAPLFQQLPLSTAPLVRLARLEVDGPDSLVALAPTLPQLVAITHLRASIRLQRRDVSTHRRAHIAFAAGGVLEAPVSLQQLCPGLNSLCLDTSWNQHGAIPGHPAAGQLLPDCLEQLHVNIAYTPGMYCFCFVSTSLTSLRRLCLASKVCVVNPDQLLLMPALEEVDLHNARCWVDGKVVPIAEWLYGGLCMAPQHLTKLAGLRIRCSQRFTLSPGGLRTRLSGLRKLRLFVTKPGTAVFAQQLSALTRLQCLWLGVSNQAAGGVAALVPALASLQQLTYLRLSWRDEVPCSTWAAVLPCLKQLRVLGLSRQQLHDTGLVAELSRLTQLQCLHVLYGTMEHWDPAAAGAGVGAHMQALTQCGSLKDVLCWARADGLDDNPLAQHGQMLVKAGLVHVSCWHKWRHAVEEGLVVHPRACPHLRGVWELQQEPANVLSSACVVCS